MQHNVHSCRWVRLRGRLRPDRSHCFLSSSCRAYQVDTVDVTGASLTFNFAHRRHSSKRPAAFLAKYAPSLDPSKGGLNWALNLFSGNLTVGVFYAFTYCSSQVPARITSRRVPNRGQLIVVSSAQAPQQASCPNSSANSSHQGRHGYLDGQDGAMGLWAGLHARALTRRCACLGNTGRCNSRDPTAFTFPDW